jgi:LuxR family transcriptional regulator, positive regulator of biofilm formation
MDSGMEYQRRNVLINLSSRLLCEALQGLLEKDAIYWTVVAHEPDIILGFAPHKVLVDAATLEQSFPEQWGEAKVILIDTGLSEDEIIRLLMTHKLDGVISTDTGTELFWKALEAIRAGQVWIDNGKIRTLLHHSPPAGNITAQESFSKREREIVLLIAEGRTNREIAAHLNISEQTVKTHISRIFVKSDVASRTQLVPLALRFKLESATVLPRT